MGLLNFLKESILSKAQEEAPDTVPHYQEETFFGVGVEHYLENIHKLAVPNPDWRKRGKTLAAEGKCMQKIFRYSYVNRPVKLIAETNNPHDKNAVMIQIAGEKVGYIPHDDAKHVREILSKHDVKFISSFISGGQYKVVSENGDAVKMEKYIQVRIKIGYK